jgi:uncharacterized cupin superfamily protein/nucleoside-diphosphate-sugar epimerase
MQRTLVILGCGYIGSRLARAALAKGRHVRVCSRSTARHDALRQLGAEVHAFDATKPRQAGPAIHGASAPTVVYSVPPLPDVPAGVAVARAAEAALNAGARSFIFLSSAGLYGDLPDDEAWIDETSSAAHDDPAMAAYLTDEAAVESSGFAGLRTCTLRLSAVYGPGRGVRARLRAGNYKLLDEGRHHISRIYIDDLVRIILAAEEKAPQGSLYVVGDDKPTTQREYAEWLCERLAIPLPGSVTSYAPGMRRQQHRGRRINNAKLKADLGITLECPTYVEGEARIEEDERGESVTQQLTPIEPEAARPDFIKNAATFKYETFSYPGTTEPLCDWIELGEPVGLTGIGVSIVKLPPGRRASYPHAHSREDEMLYVLEGTPDLWIDGRVYRLRPGDVAGFPAGTGIAHTLLNNTAAEVRVLVAGERDREGDKVCYPLNPEREQALREHKPARLWTDAPKRDVGPHDGKTDVTRR